MMSIVAGARSRHQSTSLQSLCTINQILIAKIQSYWLMEGFMMNISYYSKERKSLNVMGLQQNVKGKDKNVIGKEHKTLLIDSKKNGSQSRAADKISL